MWILRVCSTLLFLCSVCVALNLPGQDVLNPEGDSKNSTELENQDLIQNLTEKQDNHLDFMTNFLDDDHMDVHEFLELTDHEHVSRKNDESKSANVDATDKAKDGIATDGTKDIILNKLLKNAGRQRPNKLQGPSLIARYVQGIRGALDSGNGNVKEENNNDDTADEPKKDVDMHNHINFMSNFLDMDPLSIKTNEINDGSDTFQNFTNDHFEAGKDANDTELENQDLILNLTEKQGDHLDFMTNFLDDDHTDVQINTTEHDHVTEAHTNMETNVTDTSENDILGIDVNVTENLVNDTVDTATGIVEKQLDFLADFLEEDPLETVSAENLVNDTMDTATGIVEKQLDFLANFLEEDPLETVSALESIESEADSPEIEEKKSTGDDNQLDFVTDFLNSDPFDLMDNPVTTDEAAETEAIDRSDAVEISAIQEENLDFLTDFLSEDPAAVEANPDDQLASENKIPQDILELYSEDEVGPDRDEVHIRKKPISSNVEWVSEEPKENDPSSLWSWFGFRK